MFSKCRMSNDTSTFVPEYIKRIASYTRDSYKDSLSCELVKETFAVLEKLVVSKSYPYVSLFAYMDGCSNKRTVLHCS